MISIGVVFSALRFSSYLISRNTRSSTARKQTEARPVGVSPSPASQLSAGTAAGVAVPAQNAAIRFSPRSRAGSAATGLVIGCGPAATPTVTSAISHSASGKTGALSVRDHPAA